MSDQQQPTLADIGREIEELKHMMRQLLVKSNSPPAPSLEGSGKLKQTEETRNYIAGTIFKKLKDLGVRSKQEAERMLYWFCLVERFEMLTQAQAEAFYIHLQEGGDDPPGLWKLKQFTSP